MNVALVHARVSNNIIPPLGLLSIASFLNKKGIKARVWDPPLYDDGYIADIHNFNPDIVGVSLMTAQYKRAKDIINHLKDKARNATYVCGGPHVSALPEASLDGLGVDIAVIGEGEESMFELTENLQGRLNLESIEGLMYRKGKEKYRNPPRGLIADLDSLPIPDRGLLNVPFD